MLKQILLGFQLLIFSFTTYALPAPQVQHSDYYHDRTVRLAFALGIASKQITQSQAETLFDKLYNGEQVPKKYREKWERLLKVAESVIQIRNLGEHFTVGYEIETTHKDLRAYRDFEQGVKPIFDMAAGAFGRQVQYIGENSATLRDGHKGKWNIVLEWVRSNDGPDEPSGWEVITPAFRNLFELENFAAFTLSLGQSPFGRKGDFSGVHLNFDVLPQGIQVPDPKTNLDTLKQDSKLTARVVTNFLLLSEQFFPAMLKLLHVERNGAHFNPFMRPYLFDHPEFLRALQNTPPQELSVEKIYDLQNQKFINAEFNAMLGYYVPKLLGTDTEKERTETQLEIEELKQTRAQDKTTWLDAKLWKYKTVRIKFKKDKDGNIIPDKTLLEVRTLDNRLASEPENIFLATLLYEMLLNRAFELAKEGKIWKLDLPWLQANQDINDYWKVLSTDSRTSTEALMKVLGRQGSKNSDLVALIKGDAFKTFGTKFFAKNKITYGFEVEGWDDSLVSFLVPRDPKFRKKWNTLSKTEKLKILNKKGFDFESDYWTNYRVLSGEFMIDLHRFSFLDPEIHVEESGNWEIKSSGRGIEDAATLKNTLEIVRGGFVSKEDFALHIHVFIPQKLMDAIHSKRKVGDFVDFMERLSMYLKLEDYADTSNEAWHGLDSWSLDRFSPKDLHSIGEYVLGKQKLSNTSLKFKNVGFRPVEGGLDIEFRTVGNGVEYGLKLVSLMQEAIETLDFGGAHLKKDPMFFRHTDRDKYTLEKALGEQFTLNQRQKTLLQKLQFAIYKPSMGDYVEMPDQTSVETVPAEQLDVKLIRTNFEDNVVLPLQPWENQSFVSELDAERIRKAKLKFLERVYKLMQKIEKQVSHQFVLDAMDFLYLCDYLERSQHPSKPKLMKGKEAERQREILEALVYELRGYVVKFIQEARLVKPIKNSLMPSGYHEACEAALLGLH